ncbi:Multidrug/Oligosaccharidyl-lipid/Polysaccharide (MOP) Flippase Superfamily [Achlya hypogyna]|uniref:Multidrug/Oligosaccharidyl-lipid/Polysaccharide (MOP) Flippase Superfamily n=1 Tax=Achlya hypogyna TaxID=1202772 RepID=A0A1V9ZAW4_ACHHY|nr:Multidrug/Oligosaccharidyl-lipid/Polysaccharide (MOP) Flippase Superfamily [Achlya hypogyna]
MQHTTESSPLVASAAAAPNVVAEAKTLVRLTGPIIFTLVMEFLPGVVNIVLVGQMDSPDTKQFVDAASISTMYINITAMSVGMGMASAMDTLCTQAFGAGNLHKMGDYLQGALLGMALTFIPVAFLNWFAEAGLLALGQEPAISALAGDFTRLSLLGIPCIFVYELLKKMLQAHSIVHPVAAMVVAANAIHVGLGYVLVHHTALGFYGAAIARTLSYVALPLMMLPYFAWVPVHRQWDITWSWATAVAELPDFFSFGVPGMLMMMLEWCAFEVLTLMAGVMPDAVVAIGVMSILSQILSTAYLVHCGLSIAATIRIGTLVGANEPGHAKAVMKAAYALCGGCMVVMVAALVGLREVLPTLFINDADVVEAAAAVMLFVVPCHVLDGLNAISQGIFRAMGQQAIATVVNGAAFYLVGIPLAAVAAFYFGGGVPGLWVGFTSGSLSACTMYFVLLCRLDWDKITNDASARYLE